MMRARSYDEAGGGVAFTEVTIGVGDRLILDCFSGEIGPAGEVQLVGSNGSGKTTIFEAIAGLRRCAHGSISIGGHKAGSAAARSLVGYSPTKPFLHRRLTAREHIELVAHLWNAPVDIDDVLQRWDMRLFADSYADQLSTGEARLLGHCLVLVASPRVLLLDEPNNGLDPERIELLQTLVDERVRAGALVVRTSHQTSGRNSDNLILARGTLASPSAALIGGRT